MHRTFVWAVLTLLILAGTVTQTASSPVTPTLPPVIVTAKRMGGGTVICRGEGCAGIVEALRQERMDFLSRMEMLVPDDLIEISGAKVCARLKAARPKNCNYGDPPASPGIRIPGRPDWQANGCGTGGFGGWLQDFVLERIASDAYSGNLDSPYAGVSFKSACDGHDQCWAMGGGRRDCDDAFQYSMRDACSQLSNSDGQSLCGGFASIYHGAVSISDGANKAYSKAVAERTCAVWVSDMKENNCEK